VCLFTISFFRWKAVISLSVEVKNVYIRRFLGYVCQIAKVRVRMSFGWVSLFAQKGSTIMAPKWRRMYSIERLYAQLCAMYARFVCGGNVFCNPCNQCNQIVFVICFPFKLLEDASLRTVFFILFPLCPQLFPGIEFLRAYHTQSEQSLCSHTWEFVEMTPIL